MRTKLYVSSSDEIWFRGKSVAKTLGYSDSDQALRKNIDSDDKLKLGLISRPVSQTGLTYNQKNTIFINESGLYSLILSSKLKKAKKFKKWVTSEVLPTIRKSGQYSMNNKFSKKKSIKIENEFDLHSKTVQFLRRRFPESLFTASLGELQDT